VFQAVPALRCRPSWPGATTTGSSRDGSWRFAERRFFIDLVGDVSQHQLVPLPSTD